MLEAQFKVHCTILSCVSNPENYQYSGKDTEEVWESECRRTLNVNLELWIHNYKLKIILGQKIN